MKTKNILRKQLERVEKQEEKLLNKQENRLIKTKLAPAINSIESKIPVKLKETFDIAFYKGFQLVFEKGNKYIEKTYNKDKIQLQYDLNNYAVERMLSKKNIKNLDKQANWSQMKNTSISVVEGIGFGILGIGLLDIPVFISVIMKTIYEVALTYGYNYESEQEKSFILLLICGAMSKEDEKREYNDQIERLEQMMIMNIDTVIDLQQQMKITSDILSKAILTAKFIQGFAIVGVVGGVVNYTIIRKIGIFAALKYKKRYIIEKSKKYTKK